MRERKLNQASSRLNLQLKFKEAIRALFILSVLFSALAVRPGMAQETERQVKAQAMFAERCKTAGEKIHRRVKDVEGVYLLKVRPNAVNYDDQFALTAPFGDDVGGDGYIMSSLRGFYTPPKEENANTPPRLAHLYVEALDPKDGQRYRYTGAVKAVRKKDVTAPNVQLELRRNPNYGLNIYEFVLNKVPAAGVSPRYGVTYDDISTREEREYWIAGSSLKVIDLQTNEVIAERIGYMMDWAQASRVGGRSRRLLAANHACPKFSDGHVRALKLIKRKSLLSKF